MRQEIQLGQKILVRKYLSCSKCNIFDKVVIDPSISNFICHYCHSYLKEISESEYEKFKKLLAEKSNRQNNQQNENPSYRNVKQNSKSKIVRKERGNSYNYNRNIYNNYNNNNYNFKNNNIAYKINYNNNDNNNDFYNTSNNYNNNDYKNIERKLINFKNDDLLIKQEEKDYKMVKIKKPSLAIKIQNKKNYFPKDLKPLVKNMNNISNRNIDIIVKDSNFIKNVNNYQNNNMNKQISNMNNNLNNMSNRINNRNMNNLNIYNMNNMNNNMNNMNMNNNMNNMNMNNNINNNPFRISRINVSQDIFDPSFSLFGSVFDDTFQNNFSSNFRSNYEGNSLDERRNTLLRNLEESRIQINPPISDDNLEKLKKFNLTEKYCKKEDGGKIELPSCCICLDDINLGVETILLPCGHIFHCDCILKWFKENNTCPMCRFEIKVEIN